MKLLLKHLIKNEWKQSNKENKKNGIPLKMERIHSWQTTHKTKICVLVNNKQIIQLNLKPYKEEVVLGAMKFKI